MKSSSCEVEGSQTFIAILVDWLSLAGGIVALLATLGCTGNSSLGISQDGLIISNADSALAQQLQIDGGIIFTGQHSNHCLPLSKLGFASMDEIAKRKSSCECVSPSLICYQATQSRTEDALRIDFTPSGDDVSHPPASLAVEITIVLKVGKSRILIVNLLGTQTVGENRQFVRSGT